MSLITTLIAFYLFLGLLLFIFQRSVLYHPSPDVDAPFARRLILPVDGADLHIWHLDHQSDAALIYFGGNAEAVAHNITAFSQHFADFDIYVVNYRGYGGSSGQPTEDALFKDALVVYDQVQKNHDTVVTMGRSLGTGVAVYLASQRKIEKLVLVTPFDSIVNVARMRFPIFPITFLIRDRYESFKRVASFSIPTLMILAGQDQVIPRVRTDALIAAYPKQHLEVAEIQEGSHNDLDSFAAYWTALDGFLRSAN